MVKAHTIQSKDLTTECWSVQFEGKSACKKCEFRGTKECCGKNILKTGKNKKGRAVPLWRMRAISGKVK